MRKYSLKYYCDSCGKDITGKLCGNLRFEAYHSKSWLVSLRELYRRHIKLKHKCNEMFCISFDTCTDCYLKITEEMAILLNKYFK